MAVPAASAAFMLLGILQRYAAACIGCSRVERRAIDWGGGSQTRPLTLLGDMLSPPLQVT